MKAKPDTTGHKLFSLLIYELIMLAFQYIVLFILAFIGIYSYGGPITLINICMLIIHIAINYYVFYYKLPVLSLNRSTEKTILWFYLILSVVASLIWIIAYFMDETEGHMPLANGTLEVISFRICKYCYESRILISISCILSRYIFYVEGILDDTDIILYTSEFMYFIFYVFLPIIVTFLVNLANYFIYRYRRRKMLSNEESCG